MISVAVGILTDKRGDILLCRRPEGKPYPNQWEFPGGKLEPGESAEACLVRELREELCIDAVVGKLFHRDRHLYPDSGHFDVAYYLVESFSGKPQRGDFAELRWVPAGVLAQFDILEGNREVVKRLAARG